MDTKQAWEIYNQWGKSISPTDVHRWNHLVNKRKEARKKVRGLVKRLEKLLKQKRLESVIQTKISLSNEFDAFKVCVEKEVEFLPESVKEAHCKLVGDWSTAAVRALAEAKEFVDWAEQKLTENQPEEEEEEEEFSDSDSESEEEETNDNPHSTPENLHTMDAITDCESKLPQAQKDLLETKKAERRSIRIRVTKTVNKLKKDIDSGNKFSVSNSKTNLSEVLKDLDKKDEEVWALYDDDAVAADMHQGEQWTDKGSAMISEADQFLDSLAPAVSPITPDPATSPSSAHFARLPKIDLPKFTGKSPAEYQTWWNSFESLIDKRPDLAKVDKLIYLKGCCIENTKKLAEGYSLTDNNYENFKTHLKEMFGKPRLVQQSHVQNILSLKPFGIDGINPFLTALETALRCLSEYKIDMESLAPMVVPHVENLMPTEIKQKWREEINDDDTFSTKKLLDFLHEKLQCYGTASEQKTDAKSKNTQPKTTLMLTTASREVTCFCCDRDHRIFNCEKFKKLSPKERSDFIFKKKHCQKCLMPITKDHFPKTCKSPI